MGNLNETGGSGAGRNGGTVLEGRAGVVVAAVLAVIAAAMAAAEWFLLPDQVIVQFGVSGEHYGPKAVIVLATATLGLGGAAWLAAARAKTGLLLSVVGAAVGVVTLVINLVLF